MIDAPPDGLGVEKVIARAKGHDLVVCHTSTPSVVPDGRFAGRLKKAYPDIQVAFVGAHTMALPGETLAMAPAVDCVTTGEFDYAIRDMAAGRPLVLPKPAAVEEQAQ